MMQATPSREAGSMRFMLLERLLTEAPKPEWAEAMGCRWTGEEEREFQALLRIPHGRFVPPVLAAHQEVFKPQDMMLLLVQYYRQVGLEIKEHSGVRPDHVGVVLEYLALCIEKQGLVEKAAWDLVRPALHNFAKALAEAAEHPLYRRVAEELLAFTGDAGADTADGE